MCDDERLKSPLAVLLNRFAAPRLVFILGIMPPDVDHFDCYLYDGYFRGNPSGPLVSSENPIYASD